MHIQECGIMHQLQLQGNGTQMDAHALQMNIGNQTFGENSTQQSNENIPASSKGKKIAKTKKIARRGGGFTKDEDNVICSAFLNVSKDPITG